MSADVVSDPRETTSLTLTGSQSFGGAAIVLREFDHLRKRMARRLTGSPGVAVGYDDLMVDSEALNLVVEDTTVLATAMMVGEAPGRHRVEYVATTAVVVADGSRRPLVLARAQGWTVACRPT